MHDAALRDIHPPLRASLRWGGVFGVGLMLLVLVRGPLYSAITGDAPWSALRLVQNAPERRFLEQRLAASS